jgi:prostaglandin-H2 D-isomerase / glutathione transferase
MSTSPMLKLTYFDSRGRAEPVRLALRIGGVPFEDHRLPFKEFLRIRAEGGLPLNQVPLLEVDGEVITQTPAMLRYAARLGGGDLIPSDPLAALRVDSALDCMNDTLSNALMPSMFERDPAKKLEMRLAFAEGPMTRVFRYIEGMLERTGGPFVAGAALSIVDIVLMLQVEQIRRGGLDGLGEEHLAPYPRLLALADATMADPRVAAAMAV